MTALAWVEINPDGNHYTVEAQDRGRVLSIEYCGPQGWVLTVDGVVQETNCTTSLPVAKRFAKTIR